MDGLRASRDAGRRKERAVPTSTEQTAQTAASEATRGRRITVVGYDGSAEARAAVAVALERSGEDDVIVVVHATPPAAGWLGTPDHGRFVIATQRVGQALLDEVRPLADHTDAQVDFELMEGPPAKALMRVAAVRQAAEIVIGSRGHGRVRSAIGSVSHELLREADRPVLIIGPDAAAAFSPAA
jgi:nucleotide-binding universal stress UspA family protein